MEAVVIYHANCMDGFGSAWAFNQLAEHRFDATQYIPCKYGEVPYIGQMLNKQVFILDFSFSREVLVEMVKVARHVVVLDHHKTAQEALENWPDKPLGLEIVFDMNRSGAGITWDYFKDQFGKTAARPPLIAYIEDRDLWRFKLPCSREINAVIACEEMILKQYSNLNLELEQSQPHVIHAGQYLLRQQIKHVESICKCGRVCTIDVGDTTYEGLVANSSPQFASDVGNHLAIESGTFGATYYTDADGSTKWSLRSIGDYDVSKIASAYGGGGHKNAAGFSIPANAEVGENVHLWTV